MVGSATTPGIQQLFGMRTYQGDDVETYRYQFWASEAPIPQGGIRWILSYSTGYRSKTFGTSSKGSYVRCVQGPLYGAPMTVRATTIRGGGGQRQLHTPRNRWCDCDENVLDDCGVCGGDNSSRTNQKDATTTLKRRWMTNRVNCLLWKPPHFASWKRVRLRRC